MNRIKLVIGVVYCVMCSMAIATNPDYDPRWSINDSWTVSVSFFRAATEPFDGTVTNIEVLYNYRVINVK